MKKSITVSIVDDEADLREHIGGYLAATGHIRCVSAYASGEEALEHLPGDKPDVILMDEPTSALDPISTSKIEDLVLELKKDYTIIMVTHNMQQATRVSDRTVFFLLGEVVEYAETEKLFSNPQDKRTEDYISGRFG